MAQLLTHFSRTYDETIDLMVEARDYLNHEEVILLDRLDGVSGLRLTCEAMRVTSRLTQVMAWLMLQRAVQEGEVSVEVAMSEPNRLSGETVCLDERFGPDLIVPARLRSLLDRSFRLYLRISHLEEQILDRMGPGSNSIGHC